MKRDFPTEDILRHVTRDILLTSYAVSGGLLFVIMAERQGFTWDDAKLSSVFLRDIVIVQDKKLLRFGKDCALSAIDLLKDNYRQEAGQRADVSDFQFLHNCIKKTTLSTLLHDAQKSNLPRIGVGLPKNLLDQFHSRLQGEYIGQYFFGVIANSIVSGLVQDNLWLPYRSWLMLQTALHFSTLHQGFSDFQQAYNELITLAEVPKNTRSVGMNNTSLLTEDALAIGRTTYFLEKAKSKINVSDILGRLAIDDPEAQQNPSQAHSVLKVYIAPGRIDIDVSGTQVPIDLEIIKLTPTNEEMPSVMVRKEHVGLQALFGGANLVETEKQILERKSPLKFSIPQTVPGMRFLPDGDGFQVQWIANRVNSLTSKFAMPYSKPVIYAILRMLEHLQHPDFELTPEVLEKLESAGLWLVGEDTSIQKFISKVGRDLYNSISSDTKGMVELLRMRGLAAERNQLLHLNIILPPNAGELAALPWELLQTADSPLPLLMPSGTGVLLTRHLDLPDELPRWEPRGNRPLRIVSLVPHTNRSSNEPSGVGNELEDLWAELEKQGIAQVRQISPFTRLDLAEITRLDPKPDIVQFTGHGWYADGHGVLFCDPTNDERIRGVTSDMVDARQVAMALQGVRMVVLTACRGSYINSESEYGLLTGIAPLLSAVNVPLVVGMQLGVRVDGALRACRAIYSAIAAGASVQTAVGRARAELYVAEKDRASWYVPTLYIRTRETGPVYV